MNFKLDENFGSRTQQLFLAAGHEVKTIRNQGLQGCTDQHLYKVCCSEKRCLITFGLDFSDVTRFPPNKTNGIVILRAPRNPSLTLPEQLIQQFLQALSQMSVDKKLWIAEIGHIRIHESEIEEEIQ